MTLTQLQIDMLNGTLLGDGNMQTESHGKRFRYRALHGLKQREYLEHKYDLLKEFCGTPPKEQKAYHKKHKRIDVRIGFNTLQREDFGPIGRAFYNYNPNTNRWVKDVPEDVASRLTARALAYLYMDDGSVKESDTTTALRLCLEGFSEVGLERFLQALKLNFNIRGEIYSEIEEGKKVKRRIYIPASESRKFIPLILPYMYDSMLYKIPKKWFNTPES